MTVRSIVEIPVNDAQFRAFLDLWKKYQDTLKATPGLHARVTEAVSATANAEKEATATTNRRVDAIAKENKERERTAELVEQAAAPLEQAAGIASQIHTSHIGIIAAIGAQTALLSKQEEKSKGVSREVRGQQTAWQKIASSVHQSTLGVTSTTTSLLKWSGIFGAIGALAGIGGGLWGIDRLAVNASQTRRSAQGLDISSGAQKGFESAYNRVVDPGFLERIANVKSSVDRAPLLSLGISDQDITSKSASDLGALTIRKLKDLVDKTPDQLLEPTLQAYDPTGRLGFSLDQARRLRATKPEELDQFERSRVENEKKFDVADPKLKAWQDLDLALSNAGKSITANLTNGLAPLAPKLTQLTADFSKLADSIERSKGFHALVDNIGIFIDDLDAYMRGDKDYLSKRRKTSAEAVQEAGNVFGSLPSLPAASIPLDPAFRRFKPSLTGLMSQPWDHGQTASRYLQSQGGAGAAFWMMPGGPPAGSAFNKTGTGQNNPFNLRAPGQTSGFRDFETPEEATHAASRQLLRDYNKYGQHSLREIVGGNAKHAGWAPAGDGNNVDAYVANLARWTRSDPDADYDVNDVAKRAALLAGISRQEGRQRMSPNQILVTINDSTGANVTVQGAQLAPGT